MSGETLCVRLESNGTIARYAAGNLPPDESAGFEDHYLLCASCQTSVRAAAAARAHFANGARIRNRRTWLAGFAAAAIATVAFFTVNNALHLRRLGAVGEAPLYLGTPVRTGESTDAIVFDSAMVAYNEQRYAEALDKLRRVESPEGQQIVEFFSGISSLMLGQAGKAQGHLSVVVESGDSPFYAEALYYRAKAQLQRGARAGAAADLRKAAELDSPIREDAAALLERMED